VNEFSTDKKLSKMVRAVLRGETADCAVAFWGRGSSNLFSSELKAVRVICNLASGATNPYELEKFIKRPSFQVRQCDRLHAKVYIGDMKAVVTSANASGNGLGLEGTEQDGWVEAGFVVDEIAPIREWFDCLWADAQLVREISDRDMAQARDAWRMRRVGRPSVPFDKFDPAQERLPLIVWYNGSDWEYNDESIQRQLNTPEIDDIKSRIDDGQEPRCEEDNSVLRDRWILNWRMTQAGRADKRTRPSWVYLGHTILRRAWYYQDEANHSRDVVLTEDKPPPIPFDATTDKLFYDVFSELIGESRYDFFRSDDADWNWKQVDNMGHEFWKELYKCYIRNLTQDS
jgi:hypothetical protein